MSLLELEKQIKPLSRSEKWQLFRFLMQELEQESNVVNEAGDEYVSEFQPDPKKLRLLSAIAPRPYEPLHDSDEAAKTLYELKRSDNVPQI